MWRDPPTLTIAVIYSVETVTEQAVAILMVSAFDNEMCAYF